MSDASFKIVQTHENENSLKTLCVVPCAWEKDNILMWPPIDPKKTATVNAARKLLQDVNSVPGSDWQAIKCSMKRAGFKSKKVAEAELKIMQSNSDTSSTESDAEKMPPPSISNRPPKRQSAMVSKKNADTDRNNFSGVVRVDCAYFLNSNFEFSLILSFCRRQIC